MLTALRAVAAAGLILGAPAPGAIAAEVTEILEAEIPPVTVVGRRTAISPHPQALTVIGRDEILRAGSATLADLLARKAFAVRRYGGPGAVSTVMLRGVGTEGVLVLRDGIRLNDPQNGGVDLSTVSLLGVERVEILEGGSSGLFGPGAVGGVINLITRPRSGTSLEVGLGSWGTGHVLFETGSSDERGDMAVAVRRDFAQNDYPYLYNDQPQTRLNAQLDGTDVSLRLRRYAGEAIVEGAVNYTAQAKGVPGSAAFPTTRASQRDDILLGSAKWTLVTASGAVPTLSLSHRHSVTDYLDLAASGGPPRTRNQVDSTDLRGKLTTRVASHDIEASAGLTRDALDNSGFGFQQRVVGSVAARDTFTPAPGFSVFGDGRLDSAGNGIGFGFSPRAGLAWMFAPGYRLRAAFGESFRQPTFNDLYWPTSVFAAGNPALRPERTRSYEVGTDLAPLESLSLCATAYLALGTDTIAWQPGAGGRWSPVNIGNTETRGLEIRATWQPTAGLELAAGHELIRPIDSGQAEATAGKVLPFRPDRVSTLSARFGPWNGVTFGLGWVSTGQRFTSPSNLDVLAPFDLLSADAAWTVTPSDTLRLHGDNLLNTYYVLQPDYPMPGRSLSASWTHAF